MNMRKMTKVELISLINAKDTEIAQLRDRIAVVTAPKPRAVDPRFMPREVVQAYFAAHPECDRRVVDRDTLMRWVQAGMPVQQEFPAGEFPIS